MTIIDISPLVHPGIPVWPGDDSYGLEPLASWDRGDSIQLTTIRMGSHTGAHLDAPSHFLKEGKAIDFVDLSVCVGPARVLTVTGSRSILPEAVNPALLDCPPRLLFRTRPEYRFDRFDPHYPFLEKATAALLVSRGIRLIGTDGPSLDQFGDNHLPVHRLLGRSGVYQLENLDLAGASDGDYELIALPLRLAGAEASPVRAVLRRA